MGGSIQREERIAKNRKEWEGMGRNGKESKQIPGKFRKTPGTSMTSFVKGKTDISSDLPDRWIPGDYFCCSASTRSFLSFFAVRITQSYVTRHPFAVPRSDRFISTPYNRRRKYHRRREQRVISTQLTGS